MAATWSASSAWTSSRSSSPWWMVIGTAALLANVAKGDEVKV
jgi:hypothetical protein